MSPHRTPLRGSHTIRDQVTGEATIMLVDDEESIQKLLTYPLEREGYRSSRRATARRRCAGSRSSPSTWCVLDVMLPRLDGLEVCRRLRTELRPSRSSC